MGCYLEDYRASFGTWVGRFSWLGVSRRGDANGTSGNFLGLTVLSSMVLAVLLVIGGVEQNPGPVVEVENTVRLLCTVCGRKVRMLQEELRNALRQIDELKARNRELKANLLMEGARERGTMPTKQTVTKCMVVGDSIVRNVEAEHADMKVECFPGIKPNSCTE